MHRCKSRQKLLQTADERQRAAHKRTASRTFAEDWQLYIYEGAELAIFMMSACLFTVILFHPAYPALRHIPSAALRRTLMGIAMGLTAVLIIHSPLGKRSGAHFNPAITITYFRLKKIEAWDAIFYVLFQFAGGVFGVGLSALLLGKQLADPGVNFAVTVPGKYGTAAAFIGRAVHGSSLDGCGLVDFESTAHRAVYELLRRDPYRLVHSGLRSSFRL
ncbi:MAG: aquaporin [Janthinobacterium lividum]